MKQYQIHDIVTNNPNIIQKLHEFQTNLYK